MRGALAASLIALATAAVPATAQEAPGQPDCIAGICRVRMTPQQLLARAETLVRARRFTEAEPLIDALAQAPDMKLQSRFLAGYAASEKGEYAVAANVFKSILADDPRQTRVRLELARAMLGLGQTASADRQFRLAEQDDLPPDIARLIRGARDVIRSKRAWRLDLDFGIAPDSNINNATAANTVNVQFGDTTLPIALDGDARAKSGTGQTGNLTAGVRLPVSGNGALLVDVNANGTNYAGQAFDDYLLQGAVGPQLHLSDSASLSLQGVAAQRWYGGGSASHQFGVKAGAQFSLGATQRLGIQLDTRRTTALFDRNYSGWQTGLYATGEKAIAPTIVASLGIFGRRDGLRAAAYSNSELGVSAGLGGELPWGVNFGAGVNASRAVFDAPIALFSAAPRRDWRYGAQLTLGNRKLRVFGFSPQVTVSYNRTASTLAYYSTDRVRLRFSVARYF